MLQSQSNWPVKGIANSKVLVMLSTLLCGVLNAHQPLRGQAQGAPAALLYLHHCFSALAPCMPVLYPR